MDANICPQCGQARRLVEVEITTTGEHLLICIICWKDVLARPAHAQLVPAPDPLSALLPA